ncbi:beta-ketoacyl synthase chain length factor [Marinomonas transparens]|uniref:Beta-ketoacyl synthase chain length factor n=1 Tax=Marinomonas transparens TaxID=2795388 RepID=A0A934N750_9GAMM|nr:beta-ketoacyl synthase chain length factor [Marinomonas transparens]MBJ7538706.1 beta-ketoacyl synthase chain length factor [Marinomonas transparens]
MLSFKLKTWNAYAPSLESIDSWGNWLNDKNQSSEKQRNPSLKKLPLMLRRRFSAIGKCAVEASMPMLAEGQHIPLVFASRHGDVGLTLSLLESIAKNEPLSPTSFSLAVHNAVSGLLSIARKDPSETTAIAATENLIPLALLEAASQLQVHDQVLCIICDMPLPDLYKPFADSPLFPYAIAIVLSRQEGETLSLENQPLNKSTSSPQDDELKELIALLCHQSSTAHFLNKQLNTEWIIKR